MTLYYARFNNTYSIHFDINSCPSFPYAHDGSSECNNHEGSNQRDVYMTFKLWELWKQHKLKVLDGLYLASPAP